VPHTLRTGQYATVRDRGMLGLLELGPNESWWRIFSDNGPQANWNGYAHPKDFSLANISHYVRQ
jgi:hypothetical protein